MWIFQMFQTLARGYWWRVHLISIFLSRSEGALYQHGVGMAFESAPCSSARQCEQAAIVWWSMHRCWGVLHLSVWVLFSWVNLTAAVKMSASDKQRVDGALLGPSEEWEEDLMQLSTWHQMDYEIVKVFSSFKALRSGKSFLITL